MATQTTSLVSLQDPIDVSLSEIESELQKIWLAQSPNGDSQAVPVATRAATFSLVVYDSDDTQQLLSRLGFYSGPIDGIVGPRMSAALKAAQAHYGLPVTGERDAATLEHLRQEFARKQAGDFEGIGERYAADIRSGGVADVIASQNPCRVIALCPTLGPDTGVTAQVAAYCPVKKQSRSTLVCCEYITLQGTAAALNRIADMIPALTISDLPKFLWWKGSLEASSDFLDTLAPLFDCIIVDSSDFPDPLRDLKQVGTFMAKGLPIADLNWRRLGAWQELSAEAFDPPERRAAILEVDQVTVDYEKGNPAQALMFLGWLASRLQWQPTGFQAEGGDYDIYQVELTGPHDRKITAELAGIPTGDRGDVIGDLIDLKLASTNLQANCSTIICSETRGCMRMESGGGAQVAKTYQVNPLSEQTAEVLLSQQLQRWGRDLLYEESFAVVTEILKLT